MLHILHIPYILYILYTLCIYIYIYILYNYPIYPTSLQFNHTLNLQKPTRHRHRCAARLRRLRRRFLAEHPSRLRWLRRWIPRLVAPWDHVPTADPLPAICWVVRRFSKFFHGKYMQKLGKHMELDGI